MRPGWSLALSIGLFIGSHCALHAPLSRSITFGKIQELPRVYRPDELPRLDADIQDVGGTIAGKNKRDQQRTTLPLRLRGGGLLVLGTPREFLHILVLLRGVVYEAIS
jgi:hypothetical protein